MIRKVISIGFGLGALLVSGVAAAQAREALNDSGKIILSADRLFGVSFWSYKFTLPNAPSATTFSGTQVNLLFGDSSTGSGSNPYAVPRFAFDYVIASGITVGGALGFQSTSGKQEVGGASNDTPSNTSFGFAPRAGYVLPVGNHYLWLRGGITYFSSKTETKTRDSTSKDSNSGFSFDLEPTFVFSPVPHFGLTVTGVLDLPLGGTLKQEVSNAGGTKSSPDIDSKFTNFGVTFGILGYI